MHRMIAAMMIRDPDAVLDKAMRNLRAWIEAQKDQQTVAVFSEWMDLLTGTPPHEIAAFLVSDCERAVRMRQSSPFAGVLTPKEVWAIKRSHEAA